jgi:hypothetical protein
LEDAETVLPVGDRLYVGTRDFLSLDVRDPSGPAILSKLTDRTCIDRINGMIMRGDFIAAANKSGWIDVFDVSREKGPMLSAALNIGARDGFASPHDVDLYGSLLITVDAAGFGRDERPGQSHL